MLTSILDHVPGVEEAKSRSRSSSTSTEAAHVRKVSLKDLRDAATSPERKPAPPPVEPKPLLKPKPVRDVGVTCKSQTRDACTSSVAPQRRSFGCNVDIPLPEPEKKEIKPKPCFKCIQRASKKFVTVGVGSDKPIDADVSTPDVSDRPRGYDSFIQQLNESSPILARLRRASSTPPAITVDSWCQSDEKGVESRGINTDLHFKDFLTYIEHESLMRSRRPSTDCGVQASTPSSPFDRRQSPFALTKALQTDLCGVDFDRQLREAREVRTVEKTIQIKSDKVVETADFGVTCRLEALWESVPLKRSIATGDDEPFEFKCQQCALAKAAKPETRDVGTDGVVKKCRDVGTSTENVAKSSVTSHSSQTARVPLRSIGTGAQATSTVDASVNTTESFPAVVVLENRVKSAPSTPDVDRKAFGVSICDKCQDQIQSVAKDFVQKVDGTGAGADVLPAVPSDLDLCETASNASTSTLPPIPNSRIPRPVSLQVSNCQISRLYIPSTLLTLNLVEPLDFFILSFVASLNESCTKNERNRICRSQVFLQLLFSSFFCRTRLYYSKPF